MVAVGQPAGILVDGEVAGTVTVSAPRYRPRTGGERAPAGSRFALVEIRYAATAPLSYSASRWLVVDAAGGRHPAGAVQPNDGLGEGDLAAGAAADGRVAFQLPADVDIRAIVLRPEGGGRDLLAFRVP